MNATTVAIDVTQSGPRYWCEHDDDNHSIAITTNDRNLSVYLHGTFEELAAWAHDVLATIDHQRHTECEVMPDVVRLVDPAAVAEWAKS
jgi:hypothetical protein